MQRRVTSGVSRISARGVLMVRLDTKSEGGGGVLYASAHSLLPFAAKIRYKSIILAPMAEGGCSSTRSTLSGYATGQWPVVYPGFQRGGCLWSGPIRKARGSGGGGGGVLYASAHSLLPFDVLRLKYNIKV